MLRLEFGIAADLLPIARICRGTLTRIEYLRLRHAGCGTLDALAEVGVDDLAELLAGDKTRAKALRELVREAWTEQQQAA